MKELHKAWLIKLYQKAILDARATMRNESLWSLGYEGKELNPHTENIINLAEYIDILKEKVKEIK